MQFIAAPFADDRAVGARADHLQGRPADFFQHVLFAHRQAGGIEQRLEGLLAVAQFRIQRPDFLRAGRQFLVLLG